MNKRWYDADPVITNAIKLIQNADVSKKKTMVNFIIREAKNLGIELQEGTFDCFWHRRQDENDDYLTALEYFKAMEDEAKRELAFKIITTFKNN